MKHSKGTAFGNTRTVILSGAISLICACSSTQPYIDEPLSQVPNDEREALADFVAGDRAENMLVMLSLSGGGTRAASLAYGVLKELSETTIDTPSGTRSLLDEVDIISSVSGGSFTSAYYGLFGDRLFDEFEERFLRQNVEGELKHGLWKWNELSSRDFGRSDMAAQLYGDQVFENKTFADFRRDGAPAVIINATDIGNSMRVSFTHLQFDLLCIDLDKYPVSRAVAASSAVPIMATPITLQNFAGQCGYTPPDWLIKPSDDYFTTPRRSELEGQRAYMDSTKRPWIHLVDGGIADNLGLRAYYTLFDLEQNPEKVMRDHGHEKATQILIIAVNAETIKPPPDWASERHPPKATKVSSHLVGMQMDRFTADSIELVRSAYEKIAATLSTEDTPVKLRFVEVNFASVPDAAEREKLNEMETNFNLEDEEIDQLIAAGRQVLRDSPQFQEFVAHNKQVPVTQ